MLFHPTASIDEEKKEEKTKEKNAAQEEKEEKNPLQAKENLISLLLHLIQKNKK